MNLHVSFVGTERAAEAAVQVLRQCDSAARAEVLAFAAALVSESERLDSGGPVLVVPASDSAALERAFRAAGLKG